MIGGSESPRRMPINGECGALITYPTVSAATNIPLTAEATSPKGVVKSATLLVTVYP